MDPDEIILLGVKSRVMALSKRDGHILWSTDLPGGSVGDAFITMVCDGPRVFTHTRGHLHGLDFATGAIFWSNHLPGCGYGLTSLALANGMSAPNPVLGSAELAKQQSSSGD